MANIWHGADPSAAIDAADYELGSVIEALETASLTGIRVWSPANAVNRASRKGHVWAMDNTLLATFDMTEALPSGWSTHNLAAPIAMDPGDFVVISYECAGHYGIVSNAFVAESYRSADDAMAFPQSRAVANFGTAHGNGRFNLTPGAAPNASASTWYAVDAVYTVPGAGTAPTITGLSLLADGLNADAAITATDPDGLVGATYAVDWGDGNVSSGASANFSHTYAATGIYAVLATVTDSTGLKGYKAGYVQLVPSSQTARRDVRVGVAQYFGGTTLTADEWYRPTPLAAQGLAGVRPYFETRLKDHEYVQTLTAGRKMGAVMSVHIAEFTEKRLTTGGFFDVPYEVHLYLWHRAQKNDRPEEAQEDLDRLIQAVIDRVRADPTLGGVVTQAGETARGITVSMSTPATEPPTTVLQEATISFTANAYPFYLTSS
jgi:PKD repeat protein